MEPNHAEGPRSRQIHDWRDARGLVIEGEVVSRRTQGQPEKTRGTVEPRWGAALERAAALAPVSPRLARFALPAGLAFIAIAALALSPGEPERHGALGASVRLADAQAVR